MTHLLTGTLMRHVSGHTQLPMRVSLAETLDTLSGMGVRGRGCRRGAGKGPIASTWAPGALASRRKRGRAGPSPAHSDWHTTGSASGVASPPRAAP